jgi:hypothetical protein
MEFRLFNEMLLLGMVLDAENFTMYNHGISSNEKYIHFVFACPS